MAHSAFVVENKGLAEEPPLNTTCQHKFRVDIAAMTPECEFFSVEDVVSYIHVYILFC